MDAAKGANQSTARPKPPQQGRSNREKRREEAGREEMSVREPLPSGATHPRVNSRPPPREVAKRVPPQRAVSNVTDGESPQKEAVLYTRRCCRQPQAAKRSGNRHAKSRQVGRQHKKKKAE